jgi:putative selenium metabolism protein SsnA
MHRTLIKHATILTFGEPCRLLTTHDLLIEDGVIRRIGPAGSIPGPFEVELDARGQVAMPGLINAHTHFYSAFARGLPGIPASGSFREVLDNLWWRLDKSLDLEAVQASAAVGCLEAIRRGCTTLIDHHASPNAVEGSLQAVAKAVKDAGLRACLCYEVSDRDGAEVCEAGLRENQTFLAHCAAAGDPHLRALFGLHASFTLSDATLERAAALAAETGAGFHIHVAEAESDQQDCVARHGERVVPRLHRHGILRPGTLAAHAVNLIPAETELLASCGATVIHNPQSNLNNAVGTADLVALHRLGVPVALGTDAMTYGMLEELRVALWAQHQRQGHASAAWDVVTASLTQANPSLASRLWGFPIGTLAEGAAADVILVDYDPPTPLLESNALGHLLFGLSQATVDTTLCAGRILMRNRRLTNGLDEAEIHARARLAATGVWKRYGTAVRGSD